MPCRATPPARSTSRPCGRLFQYPRRLTSPRPKRRKSKVSVSPTSSHGKNQGNALDEEQETEQQETATFRGRGCLLAAGHPKRIGAEEIRYRRLRHRNQDRQR